MRNTLLVLFACLVIGLASPVSGQTKDPLPPDPLLQHTREVLRATFEKGMIGLRPFVTTIKDEPYDSPRLKAIREFAESAHQIHLAWKLPNGDARLRAFMNPEDLEVTRPSDTEGKLKNEVLLRHTVPLGVELKSPEGKIVRRIVWELKFTISDDKFVLESIQKTFVIDSGQSAGVFLDIQV